MDINWYLLAIAILAKENVSVEGAEDLWKKGKVNNNYLLDFSGEMYEYNQAGMTQAEIGALFGISAGAVNQRLVRWRRQMRRIN